MAYGKKKFRKKRYGNKKRKWRQQKISVGTIQKIAKAVAVAEDEKNIENLFSEHVIGLRGTVSSRPSPQIVSKWGLSSALTGVKEPLLFHPFTIKSQITGVGPEDVKDGNGYRKGQEIMLKGLAVKGIITLPAGQRAGSIRVVVVRCDQHFADLYDKMPFLDRMKLRRQIGDDEYKISYVINHTYTYGTVPFPQPTFPPAATTLATRQIKVDLYKKMNKRIEYNKQLQDNLSCNQGDFKEDRYILSITSQEPHLIVGPVVPHTFPEFQGQFLAYYTDA